MNINLGKSEVEIIIKALRKDKQDFTAERFEKILKLENGKTKKQPMSNERGSYSVQDTGWGANQKRYN